MVTETKSVCCEPGLYWILDTGLPGFCMRQRVNKLQLGGRHDYDMPLYTLHAAAQLQPIHALRLACGAQRALFPVAVGSMNIHDVRDRRQTASLLNAPAQGTGA